MPKSREQAKKDAAKLAAKQAAEAQAEAEFYSMYKPGYDVKDFKNISFSDFMRMKERANSPQSYGLIPSIFGMNQKLKDDIKYIQDKGMVTFNPETDQAYVDNKVNELFPERAFGLDYAKGQYVSGDQSTDGKVDYVDMDGDKHVIRNSGIPTNVATGQTFSGDGGNASGVVVVDKKVVTPQAPVTQSIDLNQIARNDRSTGIADIPKVSLKPELRNNEYGYHMQDGTNFWTVNDTDPYWDNRVMGTGSAWSHADTKQPKKELDTKAISNFFSSLFN